MMNAAAAPPQNGDPTLITKPGPNDVLLGRGFAVNNFPGNQRFRDHVAKRKLEYRYARNRRKREIAEEICDQIHALGGRFLRPATDVHSAKKENVWRLAEEAARIEKCQQALREKTARTNHEYEGLYGEIGSISPFPIHPLHGRLNQGHGVLGTAPLGVRSEMVPRLSVGSSVIGGGMLDTLRGLHRSQASIGPSMLASSYRGFPRPHPVLPSNLMSTFLPASARRSGTSYSIRSGPTLQLPGLTSTSVQRPRHPSKERSEFAGTTAALADRTGTCGEATTELARNSGTRDEFVSQPADSQNEASDFLLFVSEQYDGPRLTEEQVILEKASLTDEEREAALRDMFGRLCTIDTPSSKRARRDLDDKSIAFLVKQMRIEIQRIPAKKKHALLEAQAKCRADEFSDSRLERFLRREGMNTKLGARRFVRYWEHRREVFGPVKYLERMTLSEALRDDLVALEAGMFSLLPWRDSSGRQIVFWAPCRHTREGYSSESMLRALWYVMEVIALENQDANCGVVALAWERDTKLRHYDHKVHDTFLRFEATCWPMRALSLHLCCPPIFIKLVFKPMLLVTMDQQTRSRYVMHDVPYTQLPEKLSKYGILKHMLPIQMGGTLEFSQQEWIADRRAAELEEI